MDEAKPTRLNALAEPRSGLGQQLLDIALASPLWKHVMVPQARSTMVKTAEANGIPWMAAKQWIRSREGAPWNDASACSEYDGIEYPGYYRRPFHAYENGNLSFDAAFEQELASRAVGARNFPKYSSRGEDMFRGAFDAALSKLGARVRGEGMAKGEDITIVDFGCGTGTSTRRLARHFPEATKIVGIDLSPYFIDVGRTLLKLAPSAIEVDAESAGKRKDGGWITTVDSDDRIELLRADIANTSLPSNSANVVNLVFVIHELPFAASRDVIAEAHRILKPGGQLWISEMDFESPAYRAQRENAMLFSLLRATEPYLDEYADSMPELRRVIVNTFEGGTVKITAATGRHYALIAEKRFRDSEHEESSHQTTTLEDTRFLEDGNYAIADTHLKPWESKED